MIAFDQLTWLHGKPQSSGLLKANPEDFLVVEDLGFAPDGEGEHVLVRILKNGCNTRFVADALADFSREEHLMALKYVAGRSGRVVMTEELLPLPASKAALRALILPLLDESDEPLDDENLIDYGLDSVRMMALAARWRKVHGDIDFVMLAKNPTIDAWWKLLSREVK